MHGGQTGAGAFGQREQLRREHVVLMSSACLRSSSQEASMAGRELGSWSRRTPPAPPFTVGSLPLLAMPGLWGRNYRPLKSLPLYK